ncbi:hypothetical protein TgHK011_000989 [Trichoderma gracile]|nr:hypothetical protein TgHK011_000989 [Trichoderma gracile]
MLVPAPGSRYLALADASPALPRCSASSGDAHRQRPSALVFIQQIEVIRSLNNPARLAFAEPAATFTHPTLILAGYEQRIACNHL